MQYTAIMMKEREVTLFCMGICASVEECTETVKNADVIVEIWKTENVTTKKVPEI